MESKNNPIDVLKFAIAFEDRLRRWQCLGHQVHQQLWRKKVFAFSSEPNKRQCWKSGVVNFTRRTWTIDKTRFVVTAGLKATSNVAATQNKTRRERLKSALYLRLRKSKTLFLKKTNIHSVAKYHPLRFFNIHSVAKHEKIKEKNFYFREKISQCRKKLKGGPFGIFQHPFCRKTSKKMQRGPFGEKNSGKNVSQCQKKLKEGTLWCCPVWFVTRKNRENLFSPVRYSKWCNLTP